jgi:penicillin-binding protein 1C
MRVTAKRKKRPVRSRKALHTEKKVRGALNGKVSTQKKRQVRKVKPTLFKLNFNKFFRFGDSHAKAWSKTAYKKSKTKHKLSLPFFSDERFGGKLKFFVSIILSILILGIGILVYLLKDLPSPKNLTSNDNYNVSTQIFDRNGILLYEIYADENRTPISLADLPDHVGQAAVAIEDRRFYNHLGFDLIGISRAAVANIKGGEITEGGSTITQQLVKNALLTREKTFKRKIKEAILAVMTEILYTKEEILEMYLNYIPYGGTAVGIESAANQYFDKHAKDLTLAEAALLAGLPQAPSRYSPFASDGTRSKQRQQEVLSRMAEDGYISDLESADAGSQSLEFALSKTDIKAPHFVFYVRDFLYDKYGVETVEKGGLRVLTTLDLDLHQAAQASLSAEIASLERYRVSNGAAMVVKPDTGEILSMIGSTDYFDIENDGQVNVTLAERQPGSSIKPIMYATAFQNKILNPGTILLDVPTCFELPGQPQYCPKNYDGSFKGPVSVRNSIGNSLNIPAVKGIKAIGVEPFMDQAKKMGITTWNDPSRYGLSLTLGGGEVRMIDMAQTFGVLANGGVNVPLTPILEITNFRGEQLEKIDLEARKKALAYLTEFDGEEQEEDLIRVMDKAPAYMTAHIMQDNNARVAAFGSRSELVIPNQVVSVKTGTTNNLKDNWTVGFTTEFLTITWVGNNDNTPMNPYLVSGVTGAAPIWNDIMSYVIQGREPIWQEKPDDVKSAGVCASGFPSENGDNCQVRYTDLFWEYSKPSASKVERKNVWIKPETGLPPIYGEQAEGLVLEEHEFYSDPVFNDYCVDCHRAVDEQGKIVYEKSIVKLLPDERDNVEAVQVNH